jgi:uncharacterized protein YdaU (DUF1376 family)
MSKDPAFLFYPGDWLGGTIGLTLEQKGAYMELLMLQFNRGHMTTHMIGQLIGQNWDAIQDKFIQDEKGLWYNKRLELEQERRKKFVSSRKNNVSGQNQYSKKDIPNTHMEAQKVGHMSYHMENENENENENSNSIKKGVDFIFMNGREVTDPEPVLVTYEAQLNGMAKENGSIAWQPLLKGWMSEHTGEVFADPMHVKNSFKRYYLNNANKTPIRGKLQQRKKINLDTI